MLYRVETGLHANITDTQGRKTALHLLKALQIPVAAIRQIKVYTVDGLDAAQVNRLVDEGIWHDPILQQASLEPLPFVEPAPHWIVEVGYRPGVTDNEGRTARDTAAMVLGIGRAIGEAMAIIMVAGNVANMPGLLTPVRFLTTAIASEMSYASVGSLHRNALFSIGLVLFLFIMLINVFLNVFIKRKKED